MGHKIAVEDIWVLPLAYLYLSFGHSSPGNRPIRERDKKKHLKAQNVLYNLAFLYFMISNFKINLMPLNLIKSIFWRKNHFLVFLNFQKLVKLLSEDG
jgi:hypothetical protein